MKHGAQRWEKRFWGVERGGSSTDACGTEGAVYAVRRD